MVTLLAPVHLFPGVKEFKLKLVIHVHNFTVEFLPLKEMMRSFGDWELTNGQVVIEGAQLSHEGLDERAITAVLGGMTGWKGVNFKFASDLNFCTNKFKFVNT